MKRNECFCHEVHIHRLDAASDVIKTFFSRPRPRPRP